MESRVLSFGGLRIRDGSRSLAESTEDGGKSSLLLLVHKHLPRLKSKGKPGSVFDRYKEMLGKSPPSEEAPPPSDKLDVSELGLAAGVLIAVLAAVVIVNRLFFSGSKSTASPLAKVVEAKKPVAIQAHKASKASKKPSASAVQMMLSRLKRAQAPAPPKSAERVAAAGCDSFGTFMERSNLKETLEEATRLEKAQKSTPKPELYERSAYTSDDWELMVKDIVKNRMKSSKQAALASRQRTRLSSFRQQRSQEAETPVVTELRQKAQSNLMEKVKGCEDIESVLLALGMEVPGGKFANNAQLVAAYRKALYKFHPDRTHHLDLYTKVEAEEKFKILNSRCNQWYNEACSPKNNQGKTNEFREQ